MQNKGIEVGIAAVELDTKLSKFGQMQQMMKKLGKLPKTMAPMGGGIPVRFRR